MQQISIVFFYFKKLNVLFRYSSVKNEFKLISHIYVLNPYSLNKKYKLEISHVFFLFIHSFGAVFVQSEVYSEDFEQYEINNGSGLYFEEMADLQVYHSEWAFVTYVNLSHFTAETEYLENTVGKIQEFCNRIKLEFTLAIPNSNCDHVIPQLHGLVDEIKEYSTKWFMNRNQDTEQRYQNEFRRRRRKRGFLGTVTKTMFGTLTEDEGTFYMEQINALKSRNLQQLEFGKKQTTIFQETLKVLNTTMQSESIQSEALNKYFSDLSSVLNNVTVESNTEHVSNVLSNKLNELVQYTSLLMISLREKQRYFFEAITTKSKSIQLITPRMFSSELERVSLNIARQGLVLPMPLTGENLYKFYQLTTTEGRLVDNVLVVRFSIPLIENKKFTLYKATSAPRRDNSSNVTFKFIVPRNEFIAFNKFDDKFATLTIDEVKNCHRIHSKHLVCKQSFPIMAANDNFGCEINLLRNGNMSANCDVRSANFTDELWVQLQHPNTYLYTIPNALSATILCTHSRTTLLLQDTGIISIAHRCRIKTDRVEIVAFHSMESKVFRKFSASSKINVNITAEIIKAKLMKSLIIPNLNLSSVLSDEDFKKLSQINDNLNDLQVQNAIDKASAMNVLNAVMNQSGGIVQILLALAVIVIAIAIVYTCIRYSLVRGGNILIFVILVALATTGVLYII